MRHWETLRELDQDGFRIIIDKTWEEGHPADYFDTGTDPQTGEPYFDIPKICEDIDQGRLDWFALRVRVLVDSLELGSASVGAMLYEDVQEVFTDGTAEDLVYQALEDAKQQLTPLAQKFTMLAIKHSERELA